MTTKELEKQYIANEKDLRKILRSQDIYDEDVFQDTCLALCEHVQDIAAKDFRQAFLDKYDTLIMRVGQGEIECEHYDYAELAALEIIDESQDVEKIDKKIDLDAEFSAECICHDDDKERLHQLLDDYYKHPQPGERNHKQACRILRLYLKGKSFREIANTMKLDVATVYKYFSRTVEHLKANTLCKYIEGA